MHGFTLPRVARLLLAAAVIALAAGCSFAFTPPDSPTPVPTATDTPTPLPTDTPTPVPTDTPTPTPSPTPMPGPTLPIIPTPIFNRAVTPYVPQTPVPPPSAQEADQIVHQYFQAIDDDDADAMRALTTGGARAQTDRLIDEVHKQAADKGVTPDLKVAKLTTTPLPPQGSLQPIKADFTVDVYAKMGFVSVKAQEINSTAIFSVAKTPEGTKIVEIKGNLGQ